jgi:DNA sulfur modification protein DndD
MKVDEIALKNFGPYFGEHRIELTTSPAAPVIVMHGENTWGKTSFINAIRWCLYGRVRGIDRRDKAVWRLVNRDAFAAGERLMSVKLTFAHDGKPYVLERQLGFNEQPDPGTKFSPRVSLIADGSFVDEARIAERVGAILHEDISRFFLFDAEMLDEFEKLVEQFDGNANVVKQQIEQVLGLPALRLAEEDLADLQTVAGRKQFKSIKASKRGAEIAAEARQAEDELQSLERNVSDLVLQRNETEQRRDALREKRAQYSEIQAAVKELDQIEDRIRALEEAHQALEQERKDIIGATWWLPFDEQLRAAAGEARLVVEKATGTRREKVRVGASLDIVNKSLDASRCNVCGQALPPRERSDLDNKRRILTEQLREIEGQPDEWEAASSILATLTGFLTGTGLGAFRSKEVQLRQSHSG